MIIQIVGTSGAGKSHLVRLLIAKAETVDKQRVQGRLEPTGYVLGVAGVAAPVYIPGSYTTPTGGCDTLKNMSGIYDFLEEQAFSGKHIVYEGLLVMNQTRGPEFVQRYPGKFVVCCLTTPLATCMRSINMRRAERGVGELDVKKHTKANYIRTRNYTGRMRDAGAEVVRVGRDDALPELLTLLREAS